MSRLLALLAMFACFGAGTARAGSWLEVEIGIIGPASKDILDTAITEAVTEGNDGVLVRLDTPGGALDSTRDMVKSIIGAPIPVIVWVGPAGSRAGSAGAFITLAAHVAAMAPGTNIGAAHPIQASGKDVEAGEAERKMLNDTLAFMESIAKRRGRNIDMARSFVATSVSITDDEALANKVIDLVAKDPTELFEKLEGREVELESGKKIVLATKGAARVRFDKSLRQKLLEVLSNPNLFYLLFMAGLIGIGFELTHPGMFLPGIVGGICLILALIATSVLTVSLGAAALILLGVAMLVAEAFVPSFGVLGIGGLVALVLGSAFLVDPTDAAGLRVSWFMIAPGAITVGVAFLALGYLVMRARKAPVVSGREALIGARGIAVTAFEAQRGQVRVDGSIWSAVTSEAVAKGDAIMVDKVEGLVLTVRRS